MLHRFSGYTKYVYPQITKYKPTRSKLPSLIFFKKTKNYSLFINYITIYTFQKLKQTIVTEI